MTNGEWSVIYRLINHVEMKRWMIKPEIMKGEKYEKEGAIKGKHSTIMLVFDLWLTHAQLLNVSESNKRKSFLIEFAYCGWA